MRKILVTSNYGVGWVSWHDGPCEEKQFMLEYKPFIEALEKLDELDEDPKTTHLVVGTSSAEVPEVFADLWPQFVSDWKARFDSPIPHHGGLKNLSVCEVREGTQVKIEDRDGLERVLESTGWL